MEERNGNATTAGLDPDTWLDRYGDMLFRYALARVRDQSVAEDLVQEALLAALAAADSYKGRSTERTWLVGILRHKILDHFRRSSRERESQSDWARSETETDEHFDAQGRWKLSIPAWTAPEESLARTEFWRVLHGCQAELPERLRTLFTLREIDGVDSDTLVDTLNISSKNNLWVMLSRARQRMRTCLQAQWFEQE